MGILFQDKKIGLALLCDNAPYTLAMTLASYERSGLLNYFDEACVVFRKALAKYVKRRFLTDFPRSLLRRRAAS